MLSPKKAATVGTLSVICKSLVVQNRVVLGR